MARNPNFWTMWFNYNHPWESSGDTEKTESIFKSHGRICKSEYVVVSSQCKHVDQDILFDRSTSRDLVPDVLRMFCTNDGVSCRDKDQPDGHSCGDYAIRYNCEYIGEAVIDPHMFNRHSVSLYYILLVIPILIILSRLLWIFVIRPWRDRRCADSVPFPRQIRWQKNGRSVDLDLARPPPSYQDLFGETGHQGPKCLVRPRECSVCTKCQEEQCSFARVPWGSRTEPFSGQKSGKNPFSESGVSTISTTVSEQNGSDSYGGPFPSLTIGYCNGQQCTRTNPLHPVNTGYFKSFVDTDLQNSVSPNAGYNSPNTDLSSRTSCAEGESHFPDLPHTELASSDSTTCQTQTASNCGLILSVESNQLQSDRCECACHNSVQLNVIGKHGTINTEQCLSVMSRGVHAPELGSRRVRFTTSRANKGELPSYEYALQLMKTKREDKEDAKEEVKEDAKVKNKGVHTKFTKT